MTQINKQNTKTNVTERVSNKKSNVNTSSNVVGVASSWLPNGLRGWQVQAMILAILSMFLYINTTSNFFALDDGMVILENRYTKQGFKGIVKLLTTDSFEGLLGENASVLAGGRYRPLSIVTFAMEYQLYGTSDSFPKLSHGLNMLLYGMCVVVLFTFLRKHIFPKTPDIAFISTFIFALHPIHTEAVANLKGRDELLCFLFMFLALHRIMDAVRVWEQNRSNAKSNSNTSQATSYLVQGGIAYFLALLSKENAITFVAIIPLTVYFFSNIKTAQILKISGIFFGVFLAYFAIRVGVTGFSFTGKSVDVLNNPYVLATAAQALATKIYVLSRYISLLLLPYPLSFDYSYNQVGYTDFSNMRVWVSVAMHIGLVVMGIIGWKKKNLIAYCAWFYLLSISIISNFVINIGAFMGERFLFQASVGFAIALGYVLYQGLKNDAIAPNIKKYALIGGLVALTIIEGGWIINRNKNWKDNETLFLNDVQIVPNSCKAQKGAGEVLIKKLDTDATTSDPTMKALIVERAIKFYHAALVIHPKFIDALLDMGACHYRMERFDSAEVYWLRAQKLEATHPILKSHWELLSNKLAELAGDQYALKNYEQAVSMGQKALKYNPTNAGAYYVLGNTYGLMEKYPEAIKAFQKSTELNPNNADYWYNLGGVAYNGGEYDICIDALTKTLAIKPDYPRAKDGLNAAKARKK